MSAARLVLQLAADPADLTAAELPELLDRCDELTRQIEAIRNRARELLATGEEIDGWELVHVRRTDLIDPADRFARAGRDQPGCAQIVRCAQGAVGHAHRGGQISVSLPRLKSVTFSSTNGTLFHIFLASK